MENISRIVKIGMASLLVMLLLGLGGLTAIGAANSGGLSALLGAANAATQKVASNAVAVKNVNGQDTTSAQQAAALLQQTNGVVDARTAVRAAGPAVVTVVNTMQQATGRFGRGGMMGQSPEALGSGVIIDSQGDILTNQHVVANQQSLQVIFADGTTVPATLVGGDAYTDIAIIKVSSKVPAVASFGDSDKIEVGQPVVAIGTALGDFKNTVTEGIVSGIHRQLTDGTTSTQDLIQTDAAINHGNSGGPLLDLNGNVIGINTAVVRSGGAMGDVAEGLGFAIPSNTAKAVGEQLLKNGSIAHPYIGISYQVITPEVATANNLSRQSGIFVSDVASGSPADKAGIVANSIITKFDGTTLGTDSATALPTLLSKHKVGDSVTLTVVAPNTNTEKDIKVVLAARPNGQ